MKPSYRKVGPDFLPVIKHLDGSRETIYGPPLVTKQTAVKYAQIEINRRKGN